MFTCPFCLSCFIFTSIHVWLAFCLRYFCPLFLFFASDFVCRTVNHSMCRSVCLSLSVCLSVCLSICLSVRLLSSLSLFVVFCSGKPFLFEERFYSLSFKFIFWSCFFYGALKPKLSTSRGLRVWRRSSLWGESVYKQDRIHGYPSRARVGRGHNWGQWNIWAGALRPKTPLRPKK